MQFRSKLFTQISSFGRCLPLWDGYISGKLVRNFGFGCMGKKLTFCDLYRTIDYATLDTRLIPGNRKLHLTPGFGTTRNRTPLQSFASRLWNGASDA